MASSIQAQAQFAQVSTQAQAIGYTVVYNGRYANSKRRYALVDAAGVIASYHVNVASVNEAVVALTPAPVATKKSLFIAPRDEQKSIRRGTKHEILFTRLLAGVSLVDLTAALGWTEKSTRAAFNDDVNRRKGFGVRQEGDLFYLVVPAGVEPQFV